MKNIGKKLLWNYELLLNEPSTYLMIINNIKVQTQNLFVVERMHETIAYKYTRIEI